VSVMVQMSTWPRCMWLKGVGVRQDNMWSMWTKYSLTGPHWSRSPAESLGNRALASARYSRLPRFAAL
jgi:hypothetical protein